MVSSFFYGASIITAIVFNTLFISQMVTSAPASSKVAAAAASATIFRSIAHTRRSCKRFQPHRSIPGETMTDILQSTLVSIRRLPYYHSETSLSYYLTVIFSPSRQTWLTIGRDPRVVSICNRPN